ncbi:hypothetical protein BRADI_1g01342v3 [Brachypodium distachyon]|uniref:Uncharacterized protein n=1 Tax=Brachypodium distachyon TaxID=15368 RepID=A0A2K2DHM4_BRADI|nr:hypothetical protein BRADI_1g01342v3 [Brachypodium distachyon]
MTGEDLREEYSVGAEMTGKGVDAIVRLFYERGLYTGEVVEYACGRLLGNTWFMAKLLFAPSEATSLRSVLTGGSPDVDFSSTGMIMIPHNIESSWSFYVFEKERKQGHGTGSCVHTFSG